MTVTGSWFDVDYFTFVKGKDATDPEPIVTEDPGTDEPGDNPGTGDTTMVIGQKVQYDPNARQDYFVFDMHGVNMGILSAYGFESAAQILQTSNDVKSSGVYMLRNRATGAMQKVRVVR